MPPQHDSRDDQRAAALDVKGDSAQATDSRPLQSATNPAGGRRRSWLGQQQRRKEHKGEEEDVASTGASHAASAAGGRAPAPKLQPSQNTRLRQQQKPQRLAQGTPSPDRPLSDYSQKLAREMSARVSQTSPTAASFPKRSSLGKEQEHTTPSGSPPLSSVLPSAGSSKTTASSDSNRTIIAVNTGNAPSARTPSYPFPPMATSAKGTSSPGNPALSSRQTTRPSTSTNLPGPKDAQRPRLPPQRDGSCSSFRSDQVQPSPSTPASAAAFLPSTATPPVDEGRRCRLDADGVDDLPAPNLYDLALALSSEPGLDAWWNTVVEIATQWYKAERIALAIPSDTTDVENMPWGQKATFNAREKEDTLSMGYIGKESNLSASTTDAPAGATPSDTLSPFPTPVPVLAATDAAQRPSLSSRYSFTTYEDHREQKAYEPTPLGQPAYAPPLRPSWTRSHTSYPVPTQRSDDVLKPDSPHNMLPPKLYSNLNQAALQEHDAVEGPQEAIRVFDEALRPCSETQGRVLPVIQALDYEADPLIDHNGVQRVLDRGHVVALTRSYPYVNLKKNAAAGKQVPAEGVSSPANARPRAASVKKPAQNDAPVHLASILGPTSIAAKAVPRPSVTFMRKLTSSSVAAKIEQASIPRPKSPLYDEYEQLPPSPWAQSPVPSPAIRHDTSESPFFGDACVDEDSFNPPTPPQDYKETRPYEALGVDNAWTVLHIPLYRPPPPKASHAFKLDKSKMERRASPKRQPLHTEAEEVPGGRASSNVPRQMPIAILSILSPVIPYPSNLRYSLEHLAPHMATSFSLCQHYSNLEAEVQGLARSRRLGLGVFSGVDTDDYPLSATPSALSKTPNPSSDDAALLRSAAGSLTSFSDNSAYARSMAGSPSAAPAWDSSASASVLLDRERRANASSGASPSLASLAGDGYFGMRPSSHDELFGHPLSTPGSSSGGGSIQRGRKGSVAAGMPSEKRLSALRGPELVPPSSQLPTQTMGLETMAAAGFAPSSPSRSVPSPDLKKKEAENRAHAHEERMPSSLAGQAVKPSQIASTPDGEQHHHAHGQDDQQDHNPNRNNHNHGHGRAHSQLHSYGADFATTFPSLPPSGTIAVSAGTDLALGARMASRAPSISSPSPVGMPQPSDKLKGLILDSLPAHVFVAEPQTGAIVWVNSRYLAYRGKTVESLAEDPWGSIHPEDLEGYLAAWRHSVRSGEQFSRTVQIRRFDGTYRWFQARAIASRDRRNTIVQFLGSYMDIHDQHIAELKAARKEEIEESELKHRILANLIPQIIFTANEEEGITFANEQWLLYTGQSYKDLLGLGFLDFLHPDDLAKCCFLPVPPHLQERRKRILQAVMSHQAARGGTGEGSVPSRGQAFRTSAPRSGGSGGDEELSELAEMARRGIVMVTTDDNGRPSYTTEARLRSKTGDYRWHLIRCVETGTMDFGKGYNSYFGSATDINDHKLLETKLKEAMDSKTRFLSNMSHEIRTPLIGISGMVSFLQDTTLNEEQRDYTNTIQTSANSLLMIINDILDLSKVDAGMMKLSFEWFHTRSLIEEVNELVSTMAIAKGLELNYIVDAEVPAWIKGDRVRIRQVLLNVIGNAIKFTTEGEIFSRCRVVAAPPAAGAAAMKEDQIMLEFSVIDTGRGFSKEEAELIFKPFSQIDGSSTRQHGGSGLGLVISRQLVELHGGTMDGTAVPGEGSTFTFTARFGLPSEADHPDGLATPSAEANTVSSVTLTSMGLSVPSFMDHAAVIAAAAASAAGVGAAGVTRAPTPSTAPTGTAPAMASSLPRETATARPNGDPAQTLSPPSQASHSPSGSDNTSATTATEATAETTETAASSTKGGSPPATRTAETTANRAESKPVFSILIICPQTHSREATKTHIETTLPKDVPYRITVVATASEAQKLIGAEKAELFTHVVVNLPSPQEILALVDQLDQSTMLGSTNVLILSDSVQRQAVSKLAADTRFEPLLSGARVTYIYKPVKPSRFAVIFDPAKERDISIDRNRSTAQQLVKTQKQSYVDLEKRMGNKGYKVLLVEDNMVNQKVLKKYLHKVGVEVDVAVDGVACTDTVLSRPHDFYSLILCDLHMPRKDGYQACQEIRAWEKAGGYDKPIPIIALSANVMMDVYDKCVEAGFNKYITKPVDFVVLSRALAEFF